MKGFSLKWPEPPPGAGMSDVCIQQGASVRSTTPSRVFDSPTV
jgi:hypothetical protein